MQTVPFSCFLSGCLVVKKDRYAIINMCLKDREVGGGKKWKIYFIRKQWL